MIIWCKKRCARDSHTCGGNDAPFPTLLRREERGCAAACPGIGGGRGRRGRRPHLQWAHDPLTSVILFISAGKDWRGVLRDCVQGPR